MADRARIEERLEELWAIAHGPLGGADRPAFSAAEAQAMRLVAGWAAEAGLSVGLDRCGNLWGLPRDTGAPLVTAGSHVDTVPDGGRYDGALGTVLGLELAHDVPGAGVMICAAEEAPRFGAGTIGSRLLTGALSFDALSELHDADGVCAARALDAFLSELSDLPRIAEAPRDRWRGHAEIHVALRRELETIAVVERVAAPRRFEAVVSGRAGHAGELSMAQRRDALAGAAALVLAVEAAARAEPAETVATVGVLTVSPGAVSIVPAHARLGIDVRAIDAGSLDRVSAEIAAAARSVARERGLEISLRLVRDGSPTVMDPSLVGAARACASELGVPVTTTWSGSGHDAQHLSTLVPSLLLFVPLHGGEGHTPDEGADLEECLSAAAVAAGVLARLRESGG